MKKTAYLVLMCSIGFALLPLLSVLIAGFTANLLQCTLNEAGVSPCPTVIGDIGGLLSLMGMFGWFIFYTVPLGLCGVGVSLVLFIVYFFRKPKKHV